MHISRPWPCVAMPYKQCLSTRHEGATRAFVKRVWERHSHQMANRWGLWRDKIVEASHCTFPASDRPARAMHWAQKMRDEHRLVGSQQQQQQLHCWIGQQHPSPKDAYGRWRKFDQAAPPGQQPLYKAQQNAFLHGMHHG